MAAKRNRRDSQELDRPEQTRAKMLIHTSSPGARTAEPL